MWRSPQWFTYTLAVGVSVAILAVPAIYYSSFGARGAFIFSTFAVGMSALLGGLWPGLVSTAIGLVGGVALLVANREMAGGIGTQVQVTSFAAIWLFISILSDSLRRIARGYASTARAQEVQRLRLETILNSITDGFFAVDRDWRITHTNPPFRAMVKRSERDLLGRDLWDILTGPVNYEVRIRLSDAKREGEPIAIDVPHPDDVWFHMRAFPSADGMFVYVQDISDRKALEAQRDRLLTDERSARSEAEIASRLKDDFVATLSHELRTPLTTMLGWTEILQHRHGDMPDILEGLQSIERSARHQAQLIDDLLDMSRVMTGQMKLELEYMSLSDLVREVVDSLRPAADAKGVALGVECAEIEDVIRGDARRLMQVFSNLGANAIKFTPRGGHVTFTVGRNEEWLCVQVTDDGEGIDESFLPFLFERFRQANPSTSRRHGGLGLGLAIVKQLVELHGGTVNATSDGPGKGSTFEVCLKARSMQPIEVPEPFAGRTSKDALAGYRVLAVDDDANTLEVLCAMLSDFGAHCEAHTSAAAALAALKAGSFDVLVSDVGMPEMDGYEFVQKVRELPSLEHSQIPAIALSAFATDHDRDRALIAGFDLHIAKPIEMERLIDLVSKVGRRQERGA